MSFMTESQVEAKVLAGMNSILEQVSRETAEKLETRVAALKE